MKINICKYLSLLGTIAVVLTACTRDDDPEPDFPPSEGTAMTLNGGVGGSSAQNSVFVDLSADKQDSVKRSSWNLGFYCGSQFRVKLNNTTGASAVLVNKTDLNAVSASDINVDELAIPLGQPGSFGNIDGVDGELSHTFIPEIAASDADNKVYVINPIGGSFSTVISPDNLYKVRILRASNGYTLQYARLNASNFQTISVEKDDNYNFKYISFESGPVTVEPPKKDWDFQWTWSIYFGGTGENAYAYGFSDLIFINHLSGVTGAEIVVKNEEGQSTGKPTYSDFSESDLTGVNFSNSRNVVGSNWRITTGSSAGARPDRFYLIKDSAGNVYKLRFNAMGAGNDGGIRGYPELEYQLLKRG